LPKTVPNILFVENKARKVASVTRRVKGKERKTKATSEMENFEKLFKSFNFLL
jgi:hypothetical protein